MRIMLATICCRFETWGFVKKLNFCSDFEHKVWSRFEVEAQARFDAGVWSVFCCWCFVKVMLNQSWILVEIVNCDFELKVLSRGSCLVENLTLMLGRDSQDEIWSRFVFELVIWTQPSGPLSLWQCLLKMTSDDAVGKSLWKETVFYKSTCIQTPFKKFTNGANMQQTYKQLCLAVKLPHEPTPRLVDLA